ncbi:hypothetical protein PENSUB_6885 [Penicillium subrubescens]|uniref:CENP-V/GFA domain-containing protein n=1 Tax=Penicillium subrubescens TaxID=1316194 RepID=A0A1Q5TT37_9EURO|nr:hypothetical protein PENSUB_6885 [Penicillium subrubescens]
MTAGGCFCGKVRIQLNGQPLKAGLCHCLDCRKLTGSIYSFGFVIKTADLEVLGSTPLFGQGMKADGTPEETTVLRAGILEDSQVLTEWKPQAELYTDRRLEWVPPIEGAAQCSAMIPL